jgi:hypothetical protein
MLVTPENLEALQTTFIGDFQAAYQATPNNYQTISMTVPSNSSQNDYGWMAQLPNVREWLGPRLIQNLSAHHYSIVNRTWEHTIGVQREHIEDDVLGIYTPMVAAQGEAFAKHPDLLMAETIESNPTAFDGKAFFATDHPQAPNGGSADTYSNLYTATAFSAANFMAIRAAMSSYRGDGGRTWLSSLLRWSRPRSRSSRTSATLPGHQTPRAIWPTTSFGRSCKRPTHGICSTPDERSSHSSSRVAGPFRW